MLVRGVRIRMLLMFLCVCSLWEVEGIAGSMVVVVQCTGQDLLSGRFALSGKCSRSVPVHLVSLEIGGMCLDYLLSSP